MTGQDSRDRSKIEFRSPISTSRAEEFLAYLSTKLEQTQKNGATSDSKIQFIFN